MPITDAERASLAAMHQREMFRASDDAAEAKFGGRPNGTRRMPGDPGSPWSESDDLLGIVADCVRFAATQGWADPEWPAKSHLLQLAAEIDSGSVLLVRRRS